MASDTTYGNYVSFDGSISLHENSAFPLAAAQTGLGWIRNLF